MADKLLFIVGGPNGAGKSTVINDYVLTEPVEVIGADKFAAEYSPHNPTLRQIEGGREFIRRLDQCLSEGRSCVVESTLSGKSLRRWIERARQFGYRVEIQFVFIDSASLSRARVKERVAKGGHDVPVEDIQRRFTRTFHNFWSIYMPLADYWVLTYNGDRRSEAVAFGTQHSRIVFDDPLFARFLLIAESSDAPNQ